MYKKRLHDLSVRGLIILLVTCNCGCDAFFDTDSEHQVIVQTVLDDPGRFRVDATDIEAFKLGDVADDLATLDGCWASVYSPTPTENLIEVLEIYRFHPRVNSYEAWVGFADASGGIASDLPFVARVWGPYEVRDPSHLLLTEEYAKVYAYRHLPENLGFGVTLEEQHIEDATGRPAVATLDGGRLALVIGAESAEDIPETATTVLLHQFECP